MAEAESWEELVMDRRPQGKDSVAYQTEFRKGREEGLAEGRLEGAQRWVLRQGERCFGAPSDGVKLALEGMPLTRLEQIALRLLDVKSWEEFLAE